MRHAVIPFHAWRSAPRVMPEAHMHTDVELNLPLDGTLHYFFAGRFVAIDAGRLAVFWAGMPHRLVAIEPHGTEYLCMTLPLAWFLSWGLDGAFSRLLLSGELCVDEDPMDAALFARWSRDLAGGTFSDRGEATRVVLLEVEARLRRLSARTASPVEAEGAAPRAAGSGVAERVATLVSQAYRDPDLSVTSLARSLAMHPNYVITTFHKSAGIPLWEYVTRLRVSHAQRLLLTSDWTVERVAGECGFGSASRFFAVFKRHCGTTPRRYRSSQRQ